MGAASSPQGKEHGAAVPGVGIPIRHRKFKQLPPASISDTLLIRIAPADTGLLRYLLEGVGGHLAMITVLDPQQGIFKLLSSPHQKDEVQSFLDSIRTIVPWKIISLDIQQCER
jgi:hypothetical protein